MGRAALLIAVSLGAASCLPQTGAGGHASLTCASCHQGATADRDIASVPDATCSGAGCHADPYSAETTLSSVPFDHEAHASDGIPAIGCAGCHTHTEGAEALTSGGSTCGLCHQEELSGADAAACRTCHVEPAHTATTTQGVLIEHDRVPWTLDACVRCHYDVSVPTPEVRIDDCGSCHEDLAAAQTDGVGVDLHPRHTEVGCSSCHEEDSHRIAAMSSAVSLSCTQCHAMPHEVETEDSLPGTEVCVACHSDSHGPTQAMTFGVEPNGTFMVVDEHFTAGLTCRSCHRPGSGDRGSVGSDLDACVDCHRPEYEIVARWWVEGIAERSTLVARYMRSAELALAALPEDNPSRVAIASGRSRLDWLSAAQGAHNPPFAHRLLEDVLQATHEAWAAETGGADPVPRLGRQPRSGLCSYCHYRMGPLDVTEDMPEDFHRDVVGR